MSATDIGVSSGPQAEQLNTEGDILPAYTRRNTHRNTIRPQPEHGDPQSQTFTRREATAHLYSVLDTKGKPWIGLKLYSSAKSAKSLPTFYENEPIVGQLEVHADKGDSIQSLVAKVSGQIITGSSIASSFTFFDRTISIWSKKTDAACAPIPAEGASPTSNKLLGYCVWPISIQIPNSVDLSDGGEESKIFCLPETFLERHTPVSVQYNLTILVSRGKLRSDVQITTAFGYVPCTRPPHMPYLRRVAYEQMLPLPGPLEYPDGWKTLNPVIFKGVLSKKFAAEVKCTLSLAKPLSYARGSVLPCFLTIEGDDAQVLDLFSAAASRSVSLRRRTRYSTQPALIKEAAAWKETLEKMGSATWWPSPDGRSGLLVRHLQGEIRLGKEIRPTSEMCHFSLSYEVTMTPFISEHLEPDATDEVAEPIVITTMFGRGPRPVVYSPPAYGGTTCQSGIFTSVASFDMLGVNIRM